MQNTSQLNWCLRHKVIHIFLRFLQQYLASMSLKNILSCSISLHEKLSGVFLVLRVLQTLAASFNSTGVTWHSRVDQQIVLQQFWRQLLCFSNKFFIHSEIRRCKLILLTFYTVCRLQNANIKLLLEIPRTCLFNLQDVSQKHLVYKNKVICLRLKCWSLTNLYVSPRSFVTSNSF